MREDGMDAAEAEGYNLVVFTPHSWFLNVPYEHDCSHQLGGQLEPFSRAASTQGAKGFLGTRTSSAPCSFSHHMLPFATLSCVSKDTCPLLLCLLFRLSMKAGTDCLPPSMAISGDLQ
ncbi:hypothetical protein CB1_000704002 [Camelus ferus]|nr:hypothetical protein CB1_000704002 [Camelus ferus]